MPDTLACTCDTGPGTDGPEIDCPVHGALCLCGAKIGIHPPGDGSLHNSRLPVEQIEFIVDTCPQTCERVKAKPGYCCVLTCRNRPVMKIDQPVLGGGHKVCLRCEEHRP